MYRQVKKIQQIRVNNNGLWMELLQIALESQPQRTKRILRLITDNDKKISELAIELTEENEGENINE